MNDEKTYYAYSKMQIAHERGDTLGLYFLKQKYNVEKEAIKKTVSIDIDSFLSDANNNIKDARSIMSQSTTFNELQKYLRY